ncbi:MAG TPA: putative Ig domain-containing protein [Bryobacteraceae bacterium]|nr:putative Ig domain-containing protein [Bryobacteraceae bacterium]
MNRLPLRWSGIVALTLCCAGALNAQITINASPPAGEVGVAYGPVQLVSGGTPNYTCLAATSPQNGLSINSDCTLTGTPTSAVSTTFTGVTATDSALNTAGPTDVTIATIYPQLQITTTSPLPGGVQGVPYNAPLTASGGTGSYTWSLFSVVPAAAWLSVSGSALTASIPLAGTYTVTVQVNDGLNTVQSSGLTLVISAPPLTIDTNSLLTGEATAPYSSPLSASGGTSPYTWALASGSAPLPAGLSVVSSGAISGTLSATATTVSNIIVQVTDSANVTATSSAMTLTVNPGPSVSPASLPNADAGHYSQIFTASSGTPPYTWSTSGTLPAGTSLSTTSPTTATLSGSAASGTYNFAIKVTDSAGGSATQAYTVTINPALAITTTSPLPQGEVGAAYSQQLNASGGSGSNNWQTINSTSPPAGLTLSTSGMISGTPTVAGPVNFTVQVTDSAGGSTTKDFTLTIAAGPTITTAPTLPNGTVGAPYNSGSGVTLTASGGTPGYTWSITSGSLPAGLNLDGTTGTINGTPTAAANAVNFTVQVADAKNVTATKQFTITVASGLVISNAPTLPSGEVNVGYSQTLTAVGGTSPYTWTITAGSPPGGVTLNPSTGALTGTPTASGAFNFTVKVTDSASVTSSTPFSLTIAPVLAISTAPTLPGGSVGAGYSTTLNASGGVTPYSWSVTVGALPNGLTLNPSTGAINGTASSGGTFNFTAQVTDSASVSVSRQFSLTITTGLAITTQPTLPSGVVGSAYSQTLAASGGTQPYNWTISAGALPAGISLNAATGAIAGTPTSGGTFNFTVQVTDNASLAASKSFTLVIAASLAITTQPSLPAGGVGTAYSVTLAAIGGTSPYSWSIISGSLPGGLALNPSTGAITGTPTTVGNFNFTVQVTDVNSVRNSKPFTLAIVSALTISTEPVLPGGAVGLAYSKALTAVGGTPPYHWAVTSGTMPTGIVLDPTAGGLSGTPTSAGTFNFTVQVTDSASVSAAKAFTLTVVTGLTITTAPVLASGSVGVGYSQPLSAAGGHPPYNWSVSAGGLPAGLSLDAGSGVIAGTPSSSGTFNFTARVTDSSTVSTTQSFTITIAAGVTITTAPSLPNGAVGATYALTLNAAGGHPPYNWSVVQGALPTGLALDSAGVMGGSPRSSGPFTFTVQVTDSASATATKQFTLNVASSLAITTPVTLPSGSVGVLYSITLGAVGGTPPYRWFISAGSLPNGLTLFTFSGVISGTAVSAGTFTFSIRVTDAASLSATQQFTLVVASGLVIATPPQLPDGAVGTAYSQTLNAVGGTPPYRWVVNTGSLPTGLSLNSSTGAITGNPTTGGGFTFTVQVTDNASANASKQFTLNIAATLAITSGPVLPGGAIGSPYSLTIGVVGGKPPYTWSITAGSLAPGLSLGADGAITGRPSSNGTFTFTVQVKDSLQATAVRQLTLGIGNALVITTAAQMNGQVGKAFSANLAATGGQVPYTWTIASGTLPAGLILDASSGLLSGTPSAGGNFTVTIQATDNNQLSTTKIFTIAIAIPAAPNMTLSGVPDTANGAQQINFGVTLDAGYPIDIHGTLTVTFQPNATAPADDPGIQLSTGGQTVDFDIPANTKQALFTAGKAAQIGLQTGTIAGTISLGFTLQAAGVDLPSQSLNHSITIARSAPVIQSVTLTKNSTGFQISVIAFSTPRDLSEIDFHFTPSAGANLQTTDLTVSLSSVGAQWYQSATSAQYGSEVMIVVPITASQGSVNDVASVSAKVKNSAGTSAAASANF